jgi:hypothetical protein
MAFTYRLVLEDGTPADPPTFVTAVPNWHAGDKVLIRQGFEFVIVSVETRAEDLTGRGRCGGLAP